MKAKFVFCTRLKKPYNLKGPLFNCVFLILLFQKHKNKEQKHVLLDLLFISYNYA